MSWLPTDTRVDTSAERRARADRIAQSVWAVIAERGVVGVSMRSVAVQAGVSTGLVQHYFGTRANLLHASMERMVDAAAERYAAVADLPRSALDEAITHVIPSTAKARRGIAVWHAFLTLSATDDAAAQILTRAKRSQTQEVARLLRELSRKTNVDDTACSLIALADGLAVRVLIGDLPAADARSKIRMAIDSALS